MDSEMDIIMDDFVDHLSFDNDEDSKIAEGEDKNYYIAKGEFILKQLDDKDNYFHFLSSILKKFKDLPEDKKIFLKETMCIEDKVKIVEKKIIVQPKKTNQKPKINGYSANKHHYDDY